MRETAWILNSLFKFKPSAKLERIIREFRLCLEPLLILAWKTCCGNNYKWIWHDCTWHLKNHHLVFFPIKSFATDSASVRDSSRFWGWCSAIWWPRAAFGKWTLWREPQWRLHLNSPGFYFVLWEVLRYRNLCRAHEWIGKAWITPRCEWNWNNPPPK